MVKETVSSAIVDQQTKIDKTSRLDEKILQQEITLKHPTGWKAWFDAFKHIIHIFVASHILFLLLTYLATLFSIDNFSNISFHLSSLVQAWNKWDTGQFTGIAIKGYDTPVSTAFFPLYPLLERALGYIVGDPFIAGLIIANVALLGLLIVLYRLVKEDFSAEIAERTVLYLAIFPGAFFLAAAYNESLFIFLTLTSFYCMRRGHWWLAGLVGCLAALTRSSGLLLVLPFVYEYLRQHTFRLKALRFDVVSVLLIPLGTGLFAFYCNQLFHDPLIFSRVQKAWGRELHAPWETFHLAYLIIRQLPILNFFSIHTVIDLSSGLLMLGMCILSFVGPLRFRDKERSYAIYMVGTFLFLILFPSIQFPVQSLTRLVLELFPGFILLAILGKKPVVHLYYLMIAIPMLSFLLLQFLTKGWVV